MKIEVTINKVEEKSWRITNNRVVKNPTYYVKWGHQTFIKNLYLTVIFDIRDKSDNNTTEMNIRKVKMYASRF